jgi:hypothetical protein
LADQLKTFAPVVLFVYQRPENTQRVLDHLAANTGAAESELYIYCDGARKSADAGAFQKTEETRNIAHSEKRFKQVHVIEQEVNLGLAASIIKGVTDICNAYGKVIVLEDDIVTSPFFLQYMNDALDVYKDVESVGSITGYWYPVKQTFSAPFFLRDASCWGWATWSRAWNGFEIDGSKLLSQLHERSLTKQFDVDGSIPYTQMLKEQVAGRNNSWAIRWDASNFLAGRMCLFPGTSLVKNIGFDGSGVHSGINKLYDVALADEPIAVTLQPVIESAVARLALTDYYKNIWHPSFLKKVARKIKRLLAK